MDDYLKLQCIRLVTRHEFAHIDEWIESYCFALVQDIMNDMFTSIIQVQNKIKELDVYANV